VLSNAFWTTRTFAAYYPKVLRLWPKNGFRGTPPLTERYAHSKEGLRQSSGRDFNQSENLSMITKMLSRLIVSFLARCGPEFYVTVSTALDQAATTSFRAQVLQLGLNASVRHPIYLKNPKYFQINNGFVAGPGLRLEAWDAFGDQRFVPMIKIGNNVCMNWNVHLGAINRIEIHDNVLIGSNVLITDHTHGATSATDLAIAPIHRSLTSKGSVVIEENVLIGEGRLHFIRGKNWEGCGHRCECSRHFGCCAQCGRLWYPGATAQAIVLRPNKLSATVI
jgi:acetyltransferase-like isoleucine patch superfamily enzyme